MFARAFNGSYSRIENPNDPLVKAFDGYLAARRSIGARAKGFNWPKLRSPALPSTIVQNDQPLTWSEC